MCKALNWPKITAHDVCLNLIVAVFNSKGCSIAAFIHVLSYVFYSPNRGTNFNINMATEHAKEIQVVRDNPAIIKLFLSLYKRPAVILTTIFRIAVLLDDRLLCKGLRKTL